MRGSYDESSARTVASQLGVDYSTALNCSNSAEQVDKDVEFGRSLGVQSTPAVLVRYGDETPQFIRYNGQEYSRGGAPYEAIQAAVAAGS
jgi:protein-disulfide isomerase